jgi:uncharacterized protein YndB with AHSA1/START domain
MTKTNEKQAQESDRTIVISRVVDAPRELVWKAITDPAHVGKWWGPRGFTTTIEDMDVRPGGVWKHVMHGPDGVNYPHLSVFKEVVRPERLVYELTGGKAGGPEIHHTFTWTFEDTGSGKTRVTINILFNSVADRERVVREFGAIEGGKQTLERLSEHLPTMAAVPE